MTQRVEWYLFTMDGPARMIGNRRTSAIETAQAELNREARPERVGDGIYLLSSESGHRYIATTQAMKRMGFEAKLLENSHYVASQADRGTSDNPKAVTLKVWGAGVSSEGNGFGRHIVAAASQAEAARIMGVSVGYLRKYGMITGNPKELAAALAKPRTVIPSSIC